MSHKHVFLRAPLTSVKRESYNGVWKYRSISSKENEVQL